MNPAGKSCTAGNDAWVPAFVTLSVATSQLLETITSIGSCGHLDQKNARAPRNASPAPCNRGIRKKEGKKIKIRNSGSDVTEFEDYHYYDELELRV